MKIFNKNIIYFDYAGATPIDPKANGIMFSYQKRFFANPSAIYSSGVAVRREIEEYRKKIALSIKAHSDEIIFTGSGTESDSLAILGVVADYEMKNKKEGLEYKIPHIITTKIEHPAVLENCRMIAESGRAEVTYVSVDEKGLVNVKEIKENLKDNTILVSVMYVNNEIGTIEPIEEIAKEIRYFKKKNSSLYPFFHTDACQAINYLFIENIEKLGVDLLTFNSSKIYGPKGIGVLYKKRNIEIGPLYFGGGQEFGLRPGTENVALIAGFSVALDKTLRIKNKEIVRLEKIRDYAIDKLLNLKINPFKIILNGDTKKRVPNNINISISSISSELLVLELDYCGIQVSEKSACHSTDKNSSHVIKAIRKTCSRKKNDDNEGSLRISFGRQTKKKDIDILIKALIKILNKYKELY
ncbi:MAG: cysteine desulfurase family protein [Candidatus Pacebacteria bacterium]|nr:cysteine desulfurase family protein [Candidatus Paceibacterota bacterium]